jgi:hypothetical protein
MYILSPSRLFIVLLIGSSHSNREALSGGLTLSTGFKLDPPVPAIDFEHALIGKDANWTTFHIPYNYSATTVRLSHIKVVLERTACKDKSIVQAWFSWADAKNRWTTTNLSVACDFFVPAAENFLGRHRSVQGYADQAMEMEKTGSSTQSLDWSLPRWYTTLNMSIEVKRELPAEGTKWLFQRMRTKEVKDGLLDVSGELFDENGSLIALTQQLWMVIDTSKASGSGATRKGGDGHSKM